LEVKERFPPEITEKPVDLKFSAKDCKMRVDNFLGCGYTVNEI
jgi:hypothetical protein